MRLPLPIFIVHLVLKNTASWANLFFHWCGYPLLLGCLLGLDVIAVITLSTAFTQARQTQSQLAQAQEQLRKQRQFWQQLTTQFPGHKIIEQANQVVSASKQ